MKPFPSVEAFLASLDAPRREQVILLRSILIATEPGLEERIKWNAPSYVWKGEDRITFNVQNKEGLVKLVFHFGATRVEDKKGAPLLVDDSGLIAWQSDIRGLLSFTSEADIRAKQTTVQALTRRWLALS